MTAAPAPANLAEHLAVRAGQEGWSSRPAFVEGHRVWTHGEIHDLAARVATVPARRGVTAGDRILIALPDGVPWVSAFLATARLGGIAVLVNPALTADEHRFMAENSKAVLCVSGPGIEDRFEADRWLGRTSCRRWPAPLPRPPPRSR